MMLAVEKERAKERNSKTAGSDPSKESLPETDKGQARDRAEREALIEFNRQREKSRGQKVNEIDEIKNVIQMKGGSDRTTDKESDSSGNVSKPLGSSRQDAAERIDAPTLKTAGDDEEARTHRSLTNQSQRAEARSHDLDSLSLSRRGHSLVGAASASRPPAARSG